MKRLQRRRGASGFTLIEVVVAMSIMAMAMVALLGVIQTGLRATIDRRSLETAQMLAGRLMSEIDARFDKPLDNEIERGDFGGDFPDFAWEYTLQVNENLEGFKSLVPDIPITLYAVEAKVVWIENGDAREYVIRSVKGWVEPAKE